MGTDILNMQRLHDILGAESDSFARRVFTDREREQAAESPDPVSYYATRFSGKEAVFKCFGIHGNVRLSEIEILDGETGQPYVTLSGKLSGIAAGKGIRSVLISLSCENEYAVAFAVAQD